MDFYDGLKSAWTQAWERTNNHPSKNNQFFKLPAQFVTQVRGSTSPSEVRSTSTFTARIILFTFLKNKILVISLLEQAFLSKSGERPIEVNP